MADDSSCGDPAVTVAILGMLLFITIEVIKIYDAQRVSQTQQT